MSDHNNKSITLLFDLVRNNVLNDNLQYDNIDISIESMPAVLFQCHLHLYRDVRVVHRWTLLKLLIS